tara:strand:+ start:384 stop:617 length:234 start_codon:yes stop_codon:yes gene_type:complete
LYFPSRCAGGQFSIKTPWISLKRTLDVTIKDIFLKINELGDKDSQALRQEYKEWLEASEGGNKQPHVLYLNQIKPNS